MKRMLRWFLGVALGTLVALAYAHQQVILIEASYALEERAQQKAEALDQYQILLYNVLTLQAPQLLEQRLARRDIELVNPRQVAWVAAPASSAVLSADKRGAPGLLQRGRQFVARLMTPRATAEAQPGP